MIEIYAQNIQKNIDKKTELKGLASDEIEVFAKHDGISLRLHVNVQTHNITNASFEGNVDTVMQGILTHFCTLIEGLPIIEASQHGVLRLEYALRAMGKKPVEGIITPQNTIPQFKVIQKLIRDSFKHYQALVTNVPCGNAYIPRSAKEWAQLDNDVKMEKLTLLVNAYLASIQQEGCDYGLCVIGPMRIEFVLYNDTMSNIGHVLLELEKYIQAATQAPIEVMYIEKTDKNRVREKSSRK